MPTIKLLRAPGNEITIPDIDERDAIEDISRVEFQVPDDCPIELLDGQGAGKVYFVNFTSASVVEVTEPEEAFVIVAFSWGWDEVKKAFKDRFKIPQSCDIEVVDAADARIVYRGKDGEIFRHLERSHAVAIQVYEPVGFPGGLAATGWSIDASFEYAPDEEPELKRISLMDEVERQLRGLGIGPQRANGESWAEAAAKRVSSPEAALEWIMSQLEQDS